MPKCSAGIDMKHYLFTVFMLLMLLSSFKASAQRFSISTNILDYACLGTMNVECAYSVSRYWSLTAGAEYNPFTFRSGQQDQFQLRQRSCSLGARLWPWHTWSGWWVSGKLRYQEYNFGGILSKSTDEGDRVGVVVCAGYTHMLSPHLNIEFGLGAWSGLDWFCQYECQRCGQTLLTGRRWFVLPDDIMLSLVYVF